MKSSIEVAIMSKIKIGLSMLYCLGEPFSSLCEKIQKITVDSVELIDDGWHTLDQERVKRLKEIGRTLDITYTMHAPLADVNIAAPAEETRNFVLKRLENSMRFARQLECSIMVFHPGLRTGISSFYPGMDWEINIESVRKLLELSREHEVDIAIENCPEPFGFLVKNVEQFSRFLKELDEDIGIVLDVGHSNINGETRKFVEAFGEHIVHVHAHDNDGKHDLHLGVGQGTVNWEEFAEDIKKVGFAGIVMVESCFDVKESLEAVKKLFI